MGYEPVTVRPLAKVDVRMTDGRISAGTEGPDELLLLAKAHYAERRRRMKFLPEKIFGEPSWDLLLDLFIATREGKEVCTSSACLAAHVPQTTALRRLQLLEEQGLIERAGDPGDHRRTIIKLSVEGSLAMTRYFAAIAAGRTCQRG